jgi:hypothetical protein
VVVDVVVGGIVKMAGNVVVVDVVVGEGIVVVVGGMVKMVGNVVVVDVVGGGGIVAVVDGKVAGSIFRLLIFIKVDGILSFKYIV